MPRPAVERLRLSVSSTGEVLEVLGGATRGSADDGGGARVDVTTSGGDRESVTIDRNICISGEGTHVCDEFNFGMEDGVELDEEVLNQVRRELDAGLLHVFGFDAATVKLFSGDLDDAMDEVRGWSGVDYADLSSYQAATSQGAPGDTVRAEHRTASGEEVTARIDGWPGDDGS